MFGIAKEPPTLEARFGARDQAEQTSLNTPGAGPIK
jgi:hypothetical protein